MRALSAFSLCAALVLAAKRGDEDAGQCTVRTVTYLAPYTSSADSHEAGGYTTSGHGIDEPHETDGPLPDGSYPDDGSDLVGGFYSTGTVDLHQGNGYQIDTSEIYETATSYWSYPTEIETVLPITTQIYSTYSSFESTVITTTVISTTEVPTTFTIDNTATVTSVLTSVVTSVSTFSTSFPVTFSVTLTTTDTTSTVITTLATTSAIVTSTATSEITIIGPTVTSSGPTITGPGLTVTLPGITGPTVTVIPTGLPFLEIISIRLSPAATPAPIAKRWLPRLKRQATEQLLPQGYFGTPVDPNPDTCDKAVQVEFDEGTVIANGRLIATIPDLPFLDLTVLTEGSIQTNFSIQNDLVVWANDAFFDGLARFCQVLDGRVFGLFTDTTGPADCTLVDLVVYSCELRSEETVD